MNACVFLAGKSASAQPLHQHMWLAIPQAGFSQTWQASPSSTGTIKLGYGFKSSMPCGISAFVIQGFWLIHGEAAIGRTELRKFFSGGTRTELKSIHGMPRTDAGLALLARAYKWL